MNIYESKAKLTVVFGLIFYSITVRAWVLAEAELKYVLNQLVAVIIALMTDTGSVLDEAGIELDQSANNTVFRYRSAYDIISGDAGNLPATGTGGVIREPVVGFVPELGRPDDPVARADAVLIAPPQN